MKKILITQSNYIPWKGYFDAINLVDEAILYDDAQYTKRDWRNRNMIKTAGGPSWLTVPVEVKGKFFQKIRETKVSDKNWAVKHWKTLSLTYSKAPHFRDLTDFAVSLYEGADKFDFLSEINYSFLSKISAHLNIRTPIRFSDNFKIAGNNPTQKLVDICKQAGATHYYSGPAAKAYLEEERFRKENIDIIYLNYEGYKEYPQQHPPFSHFVTILDLLFHTGMKATSYMKSFGHGT